MDEQKKNMEIQTINHKKTPLIKGTPSHWLEISKFGNWKEMSKTWYDDSVNMLQTEMNVGRRQSTNFNLIRKCCFVLHRLFC